VDTLLHTAESNYLQPAVDYNLPRFIIVLFIHTAPLRVLTSQMRNRTFRP